VKCAKETVYIKEYVKQNRRFGHNITKEEYTSVFLGIHYPLRKHFLQKNNNISNFKKVLCGVQVSRCLMH
jgi:predicted phosphohydrolase